MTASTAILTDHWIDGAAVSGPGTIEVVNPATGVTIAEVPRGGRSEIDAAVLAAQRAFPAWASTPVADRVAAVLRIREGIKNRHEELAQSITAEMGSPIAFSRSVQLGMPMASSKGVAGVAEDFAWSEEIGNSLVVREPIGVVGAITPWNYPLHQVVAKVGRGAGRRLHGGPQAQRGRAADGVRPRRARRDEVGPAARRVQRRDGTGPEPSARRSPRTPASTWCRSPGRPGPAAGCSEVARRHRQAGRARARRQVGQRDAAPTPTLPKAVKVGVGNCFINGGQTCTAWTRMLVPADRHDEVVELGRRRGPRRTGSVTRSTTAPASARCPRRRQTRAGAGLHRPPASSRERGSPSAGRNPPRGSTAGYFVGPDGLRRRHAAT